MFKDELLQVPFTKVKPSADDTSNYLYNSRNWQGNMQSQVILSRKKDTSFTRKTANETNLMSNHYDSDDFAKLNGTLARTCTHQDGNQPDVFAQKEMLLLLQPM